METVQQQAPQPTAHGLVWTEDHMPVVLGYEVNFTLDEDQYCIDVVAATEAEPLCIAEADTQEEAISIANAWFMDRIRESFPLALHQEN